MIQGKCSFVAACRDYFNDRKVEITEYKSLSPEDRKELRQMLIEAGYDVDELGSPPPQAV